MEYLPHAGSRAHLCAEPLPEGLKLPMPAGAASCAGCCYGLRGVR